MANRPDDGFSRLDSLLEFGVVDGEIVKAGTDYEAAVASIDAACEEMLADEPVIVDMGGEG